MSDDTEALDTMRGEVVDGCLTPWWPDEEEYPATGEIGGLPANTEADERLADELDSPRRTWEEASVVAGLVAVGAAVLVGGVVVCGLLWPKGDANPVANLPQGVAPTVTAPPVTVTAVAPPVTVTPAPPAPVTITATPAPKPTVTTGVGSQDISPRPVVLPPHVCLDQNGLAAPDEIEGGSARYPIMVPNGRCAHPEN